MNTYSITPLTTLSLDIDMSLLVYGNGFGVKTEARAMCWLVRGDAGVVLVDSGVDASHPVPAGVGEPKNRARIDVLLAGHGVRPEEVEAIILTHLHWEQCGNLDLFPRATLYVQKRELDYALAPYPYHWRDYQALAIGATPPWFAHLDRLTVVEGDYAPKPGLTVHHLPGHTPGMQNVAVATDDGVTLIAGHNVPLPMNWDGNGKHKPIPGGIHLKLSDYYRSLAKMPTLCDQVLPAQI